MSTEFSITGPGEYRRRDYTPCDLVERVGPLTDHPLADIGATAIRIQIGNIYDFYKMPEEDRKALIGSSLVENRTIFYPVGVNSFNYGCGQGLLGLNKPLCLVLSKKQLERYRGDPTWFSIFVKSPDDIDMELVFKNLVDQEATYARALEFMDTWSSAFVDMSYREMLLFIHSCIGGVIEYCGIPLHFTMYMKCDLRHS